VIVTTAGSPSGTTATASATPVRNISPAGDGERYAGEKHLARGLADEPSDQSDDGRCCDGQDAELAAKHGQLALQRRRFPANHLCKAGDPAELGIHPGGDDHAGPAPVRYGRAHPSHRTSLGEGCVLGGRRGRLGARRGFAGQSGFVRLQVQGLGQAQVRRDPIPDLEPDQITGYQLGRVDLALHAIAKHTATRREHATQSIHRALGLPLLHEAEHAVEHHDREDGDGIAGLTDRNRDRRRDQQNHDEDVGELAQQHARPSNVPLFRDHVGAVSPQAFPGVLAGKPPCGVRFQVLRHLRHRRCMPRCGRCSAGQVHG